MDAHVLQPKVTVIVFAYNQEQYIAQAINSILMQQTDFAYRINILEDCSTDRTRAIVLDFQRQYPDQIWVDLPAQNQNNNKAFATAVSTAQSQYIALLDGDDYWTSPHKLQRQVDFLDHHPEIVTCFHAVKVFYEDGSRPDRISKSQKPVLTIADILEGLNIQTGSTIFPRDAVQHFPAWYQNAGIGDWELHIFLAQHGQVAYLDEVMSAYRKHRGGIYTSASRISVLKSRVAMYNQIDAHLDFRYHTLIRSLVGRIHYELAEEYATIGDQVAAKKHLTRSLLIAPLNRRLPYRNLIHTALRLHTPGMYNLLLKVFADKVS